MFERYPEYEYFLASGQLAFAMLGMGALLAPRDFLDVLRNPRALGIGLATQLATVPLLALLLGRALPVEPGIAAGLALVAAVPGGTMSNVFTYLGRGNLALSISLTGVTTVAALVTTPILLRWLVAVHLPAEFEMPVARVAFEIAVVLLLPLSAGMFIGARFPARRDAIARWSIWISITFILSMVVGSAGSGRLDPRAYGVMGPVAIFLLCILAAQAAYASSRLAGLCPRDRLTISVEATIRNTNLAILVKASLFPAVAGVADPIGDGMFFVALLYGGLALPVAVVPVLIHRRSGGTV